MRGSAATWLLGTSALLATGSVAHAQSAATSQPTPADMSASGPAPDDAEGEVLVTGSRIRRDGYDQPTPVLDPLASPDPPEAAG